MLNKEYICLVAGLPEYSLESEAKGLDLDALLEEIFDELSRKDAQKVRLLYGYYDCENLAAAYAGRNYFNPLGRVPKETISAIVSGELSGEVDSMSIFSDEVAAVVMAYTSKSSSVNVSETSERFEKALFTAYYEACAKSKSALLRAWSEADCNLRNLTAAITARSMERSVDDVVVGEEGVVEQLTRSSAADFGLRGELSYIDAVISAVNDEPNLVEKERRIDMVRWGIIDELMEGEYFSVDFILGYLVKVNILARWRMLDPERGREMFNMIMKEFSGKDLINKQ